MKKTILGMMIASLISTSAFATNCGDAYDTRAMRRSVTNMATFGAVGIASFFTGLTPIFLVGGGATIITAGIIKKGQISNQFDTINQAINASTYHMLDDESFLKVAKKINRKANKQFGLNLDNATIAKLIYEADVKMEICPVVRVTKNGDEKRGAMPLKGFVDYIATVAGTGKTEVKIVNLNSVH